MRQGKLHVRFSLQQALVHPERPAHFQLLADQNAEVLQRFLLARGQLARPAIDDAQRAEGVPLAGFERHAGVEPDVGRARDERVVAESVIEQRIGHLK